MFTFRQFQKLFLSESAVLDQLKVKARGKETPNGRGEENRLHSLLYSQVRNDYSMATHVQSKYPAKFGIDGSMSRMHGDIQKNPELHKHGFPSDHIIDKLAEGDPSKDKKHLPQIADWYSKGHFRAEDLGSAESHAEHKNYSTVHGTLAAFQDIKNKEHFPNFPHPTQPGTMLKGTSIKSYSHMTFPEFRSHVHEKLGLNKASGENVADHPDVELIAHHDGTKLYHIKSESAAKHVAKCAGADWCTGYEGSTNMFENYSNNLHLLHGKDGVFHQLHQSSHQFMDKKDEPVAPHELAKKYPEIKKFPQLNGYIAKDHSMPFDSEEGVHKEVERRLGDMKDPNLNIESGHRSFPFIAKNGNHEHLKQLSAEMDKRGSLSQEHGNLAAPRALTNARLAVDFNEDSHPYHGPKGTAEHLANLFDKEEHLRRTIDSVPRVAGGNKYVQPLMNKYTPLNTELNVHIDRRLPSGSTVNWAHRKGESSHISLHGILPKNNLEKAHAFLNRDKKKD